MREFHAGNAVVLRATIRNSSGVATTPSNLTLRLMKNNVEQTAIPLASLTAEGTGIYSYEFVPAQGSWWARFQATSPTTSSESFFEVHPSPFGA